MKNLLKTLFSLSFILLLTNCNDRDDDVDFTKDFLKQTSWQGEITNPGGTGTTDKVGVDFLTSEGGYMEMTILNDLGQYVFFGGESFSYQTDTKSLLIRIGWPVYSGRWMLKEVSEQKLVLVMNPSSATKSYVMTLNRVL